MACHIFMHGVAILSILPNKSFLVMNYLVDIIFQFTTPSSSQLSPPSFKTPTKHYPCWHIALGSILVALSVYHCSYYMQVPLTIGWAKACGWKAQTLNQGS